MRTLTVRACLNGGAEPEERVLVVDHRDIRSWLATTRPGQPLAWARDEEAVQASWLAWHAARREEWGPKTYEEWDKHAMWVEDVAEEEVVPTGLAMTATSSP